jgi:hypothetical protein
MFWRFESKSGPIALALVVSTLALSTSASAKSGWQKPFVFDVPTGQVNQFVHYVCPAEFPVASSGAFVPNTAASSGLILRLNGPRLDFSPPVYNEWAWSFNWKAGAASGSQIRLSVYCRTS